MIKELYKFVYRDVKYTVTSSDSPQSFEGDLYECVAITRGQILTKNEMNKENIDITFGPENPFANEVASSLLEDAISLTIFKLDTENSRVNVVMKGRVASVKRDSSSITLNFETFYTSLRRLGLRRKYQRNCPLILYQETTCRLRKQDWQKYAWVENMPNKKQAELYMPEEVAGDHLVGGIVETVGYSARFVTSQLGNTVTFIRIDEMLWGEFVNTGWGECWGDGAWHWVKVKIAPGCNRSMGDCGGKFNNLLNYGGFPYIPFKNPYGGTSIV